MKKIYIYKIQNKRWYIIEHCISNAYSIHLKSIRLALPIHKNTKRENRLTFFEWQKAIAHIKGTALFRGNGSHGHAQHAKQRTWRKHLVYSGLFFLQKQKEAFTLTEGHMLCESHAYVMNPAHLSGGKVRPWSKRSVTSRWDGWDGPV